MSGSSHSSSRFRAAGRCRRNRLRSVPSPPPGASPLAADPGSPRAQGFQEELGRCGSGAGGGGGSAIAVNQAKTLGCCAVVLYQDHAFLEHDGAFPPPDWRWKTGKIANHYLDNNQCLHHYPSEGLYFSEGLCFLCIKELPSTQYSRPIGRKPRGKGLFACGL